MIDDDQDDGLEGRREVRLEFEESALGQGTLVRNESGCHDLVEWEEGATLKL